jgi:hypothetical protein
MHVARSLLVLGSAAVMLAGSMLLAIGSTVTTAAARARAIARAPHLPASHRPASHLPVLHLSPSHLPAGFLAAERSSLVRYLRGAHPQVELVRRGRLDSSPGGASQAASYNWSGYADFSATRGTFTQVSGQWTTPRVTCGSEDTITSQWVGIDGWSDQTAEQDGTLAWCFKGSATYFTWYEMYPAGPVAVGMSLQPGDKITASVSRSGPSYRLSVTDSTHPADSFARTASCAVTTCLDTSAEWIAERPSFAIGIGPLADYASWRLTGAAETAGGRSGTIASFPSREQTNMVDGTDSYQLSSASPLTDGNSFTTTWRISY